MRGKPQIVDDGHTVTVRVPISIKPRGGRKLVLTPDGLPCTPISRRIDSALVKAIARAFRWREMLESGKYQTIAEIAAAESINHSFVCRMLRLTLLSPTVVEAVLGGRHPPKLKTKALQRFPVEWNAQARAFE